MDQRQIIIGQKAVANYVLAVAHATAEQSVPVLVARGNQTGKAVEVAMQAARSNMVKRPRQATVGQMAHPAGGAITTLRIDLSASEVVDNGRKPDGTPLIVGKKEPSVYALAIRARFAAPGTSSVLVRARTEGAICKALTAANLAASLGFAEQPTIAFIGEEAAEGGRIVPFVEIVVRARATAEQPASGRRWRLPGFRTAAA